MSIEDDKKFMAGIWDWGILMGCFGDSRIEPTDIDGFVERNGRYLVLETKALNAPVKLGQRLTFESMQRDGLHTVIVVWGEKNKPERAQVYTRHKTTPVFPCNLERLRELVSQWYAYADSLDNGKAAS